MFYQDGGPGPMVGGQQPPNVTNDGKNNMCVYLSAQNHNHWCFLRKNFNKQDNDLVEHLFEIHDKFCHHCKDRLEAKKSSKKRKYEEEPTAPEPAEEEPEEELTEEELEMKRLMGFSGFKSTKGFRVKDNNYSTMASVNVSGPKEEDNAVDQTTTLTEEEKRMIASIGGFSVFSKPDSSASASANPGFGAPAVTFEPVEGNGPGYSNEPLFDKSTDSQKDSQEGQKDIQEGEQT